jgi:hypothetical protein
MMLNKLPSNTQLSNILEFLESFPRWSARNRCLFALRQVLRIKDISVLRVSDVINQNGIISECFISGIDGVHFELDLDLRSEIERYLRFLFSVRTSESLKQILESDTDIPLFATQKKACGFSPNTLAQHYSLTDRVIHRHFAASTGSSVRSRTQNLLREQKSDSYI